MMATRKQPGTPTYHSMSARNGQTAKRSVPRRMQSLAEIACENQMRAFKNGFLLGVALTGIIVCVILWFWVIPTMDGCVEAMRAVVG